MAFATAGCYHLWEKTLKSFIVRELEFYGLSEDLRRRIHGADHNTLLTWLELMGFDLTACPYAGSMNISRLIANTVKHGDGKSCDELARQAPALLKGPYNISSLGGTPRAEDLWIDADTFAQLADAIESFWRDLPEHLPVPPGGLQ